IPPFLCPNQELTYSSTSDSPILDIAVLCSNQKLRLFLLTTQGLCEWKKESNFVTIFPFTLPETILPFDCKIALSSNGGYLVVCLCSKLLIFTLSTTSVIFLKEWSVELVPSKPCKSKLLFDPYRPTIFLTLIQGHLTLWDIQSEDGILCVHRLEDTHDFDILHSETFPSTIITSQLESSKPFRTQSRMSSLFVFRVCPWLYTAVNTSST
ncbi:hypothetical protein HMI56_001245, partial [Coelomomyces lativittatus]